MFDRFLPDVSDKLRALPQLFGSAQRVDDQVQVLSVSEHFRDHGLVPFGRDLARLASRPISSELLFAVATGAAESVSTLTELQDVGIVRRAFQQVVAAVEATASHTASDELTETPRIDRDLVRTLRELHQEVVRLTVLQSQNGKENYLR